MERRALIAQTNEIGSVFSKISQDTLAEMIGTTRSRAELLDEQNSEDWALFNTTANCKFTIRS